MAVDVGVGEALGVVSGVAVTVGIAVVVGAAVAEATGVDEEVAVASKAEEEEVVGTGVEDGVASVVPQPVAAIKDRSNSAKEKANTFLTWTEGVGICHKISLFCYSANRPHPNCS